MVDRPLLSTIDAAAASRASWDAVVIGAGPAGAIAAAGLAAEGATTLLVDRASFPRGKVCGCCLSVAALRTLDAAGLADLRSTTGATPLRDLRLSADGRTASLPMRGVAVSRERLDRALVEAANAAGARFLAGTPAVIGGSTSAGRIVRLGTAGARRETVTRVAIAATGLGARVFADEDDGARAVDRHSRLGVGAIVDAGDHDRAPGRLEMAVAPRGYVGLVVLEDGRLDLAAALDPTAVRAEGVAAVVGSILRSAGVRAPAGVGRLRWVGTPPLTQRRTRLAGPGFFVVGDAAAYVEPFTGEGMAWALASGRAVVPFARRAIDGAGLDAVDGWSAAHRRLLAERQRRCRAIGRLLRHERLTRFTIRVLRRFPGLARPVVRRINRPFPS